MRLLHLICTTSSESGGPIEVISRTSEVLLRKNFEITIASLESSEEISDRGFPCAHIALGRGFGKYRYDPGFTRWIKQNASRFDAAIIHGIWNYASFGAWRALRRLDIPYFVFIHGMMDPWFRQANPLKHFAKQIYWFLIEGRVLRDARRILFTCEEEMLRARAVFQGHVYEEQVIHIGTAAPSRDVSAQRATFHSTFPFLKNKRFSLFLGRIHPKKGCDMLLRAFAECLEDLPEDKDLVFAGPDQIGWKEELERLSTELDISERVHWTGMLSGDLKWGALHLADSLILPSHQENFGFVVAEAMACGTPVLVSDKINIWHEIVESESGFVEADSLEGTIRLLRRFEALSPESRAQMSRKAKIGFGRFFDIESTALDFARAIQALVTEGRPTGSAQCRIS
jgi:glycosyltransferase involved in cell wall biosynthesis